VGSEAVTIGRTSSTLGDGGGAEGLRRCLGRRRRRGRVRFVGESERREEREKQEEREERERRHFVSEERERERERKCQTRQQKVNKSWIFWAFFGKTVKSKNKNKFTFF